jgi:glycosyltransferase involved in cell wall biosynthesis
MSKVKSVCFIEYNSFPQTSSFGFSKYVAENNYRVTVIAVSESGHTETVIIDGLSIIRIGLPNAQHYKNTKFIFLQRAIRYLDQNPHDIIHIFSSCHFFIFLKLFGPRNSKFIYHLRSYPLSTRKYKILKSKLLIFLQCLLMDRVIIISTELKKNMFGLRQMKKAVVVPVGFFHEIFMPLPPKDIEKTKVELGIPPSNRVLVYCGVIDRLRQLDRLLICFAHILKTRNDVILLVIGNGNAYEDLDRMSRSLNIENHLILFGAVPYHKVAGYIAVGDVALSFIPINEIYNFNPPLKTFEYLGTGIPTVATKTVSNQKIITDKINGLLVSDIPRDVANAVLKLLEDKELRTKLRKNGRQSVMPFTFKNIVKNRLLPIYDILLQ